MPFTPYLFFAGTCREAMTAYQGIFGGELQVVTAAEMGAPAGIPAEAVMHAELALPDGTMLLASDDPTTDTPGPKEGFRVCLNPADLDEANRLFDALADGGEVVQALEPMQWTPGFAMLTDRYGTPWMISTLTADD
jgi:PhnB protein